jgi:thiamine transport system ATP-binding protein
MLRLEDVGLGLGAFHLSVDLNLQQGARLAVMGASGSGKSTLLSLVAGFMLPDLGRIHIAGQDVTDWPVAARPVSILFQDGNLFPHLDVFDNVALGVDPNLRLSAIDRDRIMASLNKVGLRDFASRKPADLSGGQQSRVALARMLIRDKPLAVLDEPFAALDPGLRREMLDLLDTLCAETGLTVVMVTHDLRDAQHLCDRIVLLDNGKVVLDDRLDAALGRMPDTLSAWR